MFVTFQDYQTLGYTKITDEAAFNSFSIKAELTAKKAIINKPLINSLDVPSYYNEFDPLTWHEYNQRGICEIIDTIYNDSIGQGGTITSFNNGNYSESYSASDKIIKTIDDKINDSVLCFFTRSQLNVGVG